VRLGEEALHPWRYAEEREEASKPFQPGPPSSKEGIAFSSRAGS
jgi:hypothetical protein